MYKQGKRFPYLWGGVTPHCSRIQLSPDYVGIELGIGESLLVKAIGESTGRSLALVKSELKKEGDLGLVAMVRRSIFNRLTSTDPIGAALPIVHRIPRTARKHSSNRNL